MLYIRWFFLYIYSVFRVLLQIRLYYDIYDIKIELFKKCQILKLEKLTHTNKLLIKSK